MHQIAITMGCPVGIGPEVILKFFSTVKEFPRYQPVVLGDLGVLQRCASKLHISLRFQPWQPGSTFSPGLVPVLELSTLPIADLSWGQPTPATGKAMALYIEEAVQLISHGIFAAMVTCPISKISLHQAGYPFPGHTEMLAALCHTDRHVMMMAGNRLRVTLATIHCPLSVVPSLLNRESLITLMETTHQALCQDFGIPRPRLAVAALNPHAGEERLFGNEEETIITPAIKTMQERGICIDGPFPPDTIFFKAANGLFDAVICMYHDQGLIPFKLLHFQDGVNVTLGLPIIRTSVDHGTAYDIAGKGLADPSSLAAAIEMAALIAENRTVCRTS